MALPVAPMALPVAADDNGGQFTTQHVVDTHMRGKALSVVYTNDPVSVESSIQTMEQFLAEDKYRVGGFDLEYTIGRAGHDQKVAIAQLCVRHDVLVYHFHLATRPCERFSKFINSSDYSFSTVDTTNDLKALKVSGLTCQNLVNMRDTTRSGTLEEIKIKKKQDKKTNPDGRLRRKELVGVLPQRRSLGLEPGPDVLRGHVHHGRPSARRPP